MIPNEAIDAAKEAMREVTPPPGVDRADWLKEHGSYALLAGAIAAAAPHLMAQAWEEGHDEGRQDEWCLTPNPYRKPRHAD